MKKRFYLLFISVLFFGFSYAQKATISGTITDLSYNNEPIPFVSIAVKGTTIGTLTDDNGKYSLEVNPGNHILVISSMGYKKGETSVSVKAGEKKIFNQGLESEDITIETITIEGVKSREKESALLVEQQKAVEIKQNIGAQELSRKGVGDVATAVAKTSGVSKQEGSGNVFVRGLGDRYNATSMNGLPVPSNDPEKKNIDLGIFSTDIVEYISIDKVYGPRIYGDFAGGNVDVTSKNYKGEGMFEISLGSTINSNAVEKNGDFLLQDGPNKFGFSSYGVPTDPLNNYGFENSLNPINEAPFGGNIGIKTGKSFDVGNEGRLSFFATVGFDSGYEYREGINQTVDSHGGPLKSFDQTRFSYKTNTTGMLNANYLINDKNRLSYNFLFINSSGQSRDAFTGYLRDLTAEGDYNTVVQRGTYIQNTLYINQLLGHHSLSDKMDFDWGTSFNRVEGDMPDRTQNIFVVRDNVYTVGQNTETDNHRYYQNLTEDEIAANLTLSRKFGADDKGKIAVGYNGRFKKRDFEAIQFNFRIFNPTTTLYEPNNADALLNAQNFANGLFEIRSFAGTTPQTYNGEQLINAGFVSFEYKFTDRLSSIIALRYESISQSVGWRTQLDVSEKDDEFTKNEFLPSIVLKYELNEKQNLRFGASKTYTLPQFKERALFIYEDVTETKFGNPDLYPSQNYNVDLKWELFPNEGELFSAGIFGKYILDPINEVTIASSTNDISWVNISDSGYVYGVEVEVRKDIFNFDGELDNKLSVGLNVAYMQTYQDIDAEKVKNETKLSIGDITADSSSFTGASDLLINGDLSYTKKWSDDASITATAVYSYFSDRLYSLGTEQRGNLVDKAVGTFDFILKTKIDKNIGIDFSARNIFNPKYERVQQNNSNEGGDVLVLSYKRGAYFSLGLTYQF